MGWSGYARPGAIRCENPAEPAEAEEAEQWQQADGERQSLPRQIAEFTRNAAESVANFMRGFAFHVAALGVAYREDIGEVKEAMQEAFEELRGTEHGPTIPGDLDMQGVTEFADSAVIVRARIKTLPGKQWGVGRAYNEIVKRVFDRRGIEIPFPHRTVYWGEGKDGKAPPLRLAKEGDAEEGKGAEPEAG